MTNEEIETIKAELLQIPNKIDKALKNERFSSKNLLLLIIITKICTS